MVREPRSKSGQGQAAARSREMAEPAPSSLRGWRMRAYPTARQLRVLEGWQRAYAAVWNTALEQRRLVWHLHRRSLSAAEQSRELPELRASCALIAACPAQVANEAVRRLDAAYRAAYRRLRTGRRAGWPRYMRWQDAPLLFSADKRSPRSARLDGTPSATSGTWWIAAETDGWVRANFAAPRGGEGIGNLRLRCHRPLPDHCRVGTLALTHKAGRWYASVLVEAPADAADAPGGEIGINRGLAVWVALSDGTLLDPDPIWPRYADEIADLQRRISRARRGSRRRRELVRRLNRTWEKIAARRRQRAHQLANLLLDRHATIAVEDYNTAQMLRDRPPEDPAAQVRHLHRRIADAAWADFARILRYKAGDRGAQVITVPANGITTTCCDCGADVAAAAAEAVRSPGRDLRCRECGAAHHVDVLAARNVLARARGKVPAA
jgi:putative transposase